jgi:uncharacterized phage-associated protein
MVSVHDVAAFILAVSGPMAAMKLHKLVYYAQAWAVTETGELLFADPVEAWAQGPIVYALFEQHRGHYVVSHLQRGDSSLLDNQQVEVIRRVLTSYGRMSGLELTELTHKESPWIEARRGAPAGLRGRAEITAASLDAFYRGKDMPVSPWNS